jgi:hypothetical protein
LFIGKPAMRVAAMRPKAAVSPESVAAIVEHQKAFARGFAAGAGPVFGQVGEGGSGWLCIICGTLQEYGQLKPTRMNDVL